MTVECLSGRPRALKNRLLAATLERKRDHRAWRARWGGKSSLVITELGVSSTPHAVVKPKGTEGEKGGVHGT